MLSPMTRRPPRPKHLPIAIALALALPFSAAYGDVPPADKPRPCTYFVAANGSDRNDGTSSATPFASLAQAQIAARHNAAKVVCLRAGIYRQSAPITLTSADDGETWQYYPPDGVNSAILDGGGMTDIFRIVGGSSITIDGLRLQNFYSYGIHTEGGPHFGVPAAAHNTVKNCDIGFNTITSWNSGAFYADGASPDTLVKNNYVHDLGSQGIAINSYFSPADSIDGSVIANNIVLRTVQRKSDGSPIYVSMHGGCTTCRVTVRNNYVKDYVSLGSSEGGGIYLDDNASNVTVTGNVIAPPGPVGRANNGANGITVHNGFGNIISGNIIDIGATSRAITAIWYSGGQAINHGMAGNTFTGNIVLSNFAGRLNTTFSGAGGYAYYQNLPPPSNYTIKNNVYHNYARGGAVFSNGQLAGDANPITLDPRIEGWTYRIADDSPVFAAPVRFPRIAGGWGPPGFVIPETGTAPSGPH
jgi:hypothetical protein